LDYVNFLRATQRCTNDVREKARAFERAVFNVAFHNRDDHPKNFAYTMSRTGDWKLAPAYDVTFCEGPGGYHQMDVMGEALEIDRKAMLGLAEEAEVGAYEAGVIIERFCDVSSQFSTVANDRYPGAITQETLCTIQSRIDHNIKLLR
jgi:serine/threonine-protein kinase HipA